jgi:UDP-N-acetylglucosamine transferase subunit ALG13
VKIQQPVPIRILVAPLDWGLGHATRCIPLICYFQEKGCEVLIAAEGKILELLKLEFPNLTFVDLRGYRIKYAGSKAGLFFKIITQIPQILQTIRYEKNWLAAFLSTHKLDAVVSDNRFGLYSSSIPSVYITHQLRILLPGGGPAESFLQKLHYKYINRYQACWIPDAKDMPNLSGVLAHPKRLPNSHLSYLGPLSRLKKHPSAIQYPVLAILSGPEPQRTLLEDSILRQVSQTNVKVVLVRGLPQGAPAKDNPLIESLQQAGKLKVYNHLPAEALGNLIQASEWIVARTGYTTVMDLVHLGKKSILIPTPGQTEQEYLGKYLKEEGISYTVSQDRFQLSEALEEASRFRYKLPLFSSNYKEVIDKWLETLR